MVLAVACRDKPPPTPAPSDAGVIVDAARPALAPPKPRRLFGYGGSLCLTDGESVECGLSDQGRALQLRRNAKMDRVSAASPTFPCWLRDDKTAFCSDRQAGTGIESVEGAPYLLQTDGRVVVVPQTMGDGDEDTIETSMREEAISAVFEAAGKSSIERIVHASGVTCAKTKAGDVWCWAEPRQGFNEEVEDPGKPHPLRVPGLHDVAEIALMPWLTLCARTTAGAILCSRSTGTNDEVCELRGKTNVRCGNHASGPVGPPPLVEPSYEMRGMMSRPLEPVPGLDGTDAATSLALWALEDRGSRESQRRIYNGHHDEGGCAKLASGAVRCWERNHCAPRHPWRSTAVEDLPYTIDRIVLGASDGYALTAKGDLFHWPRRESGGMRPCSAPPLTMKAEPVVLPAPAFAVYGRPVRQSHRPGTDDVDCVSLVNGEVTCWGHDYQERKLLPLDRERDAGTGSSD